MFARSLLNQMLQHVHSKTKAKRAKVLTFTTVLPIYFIDCAAVFFSLSFGFFPSNINNNVLREQARPKGKRRAKSERQLAPWIIFHLLFLPFDSQLVIAALFLDYIFCSSRAILYYCVERAI